MSRDCSLLAAGGLEVSQEDFLRRRYKREASRPALTMGARREAGKGNMRMILACSLSGLKVCRCTRGGAREVSCSAPATGKHGMLNAIRRECGRDDAETRPAHSLSASFVRGLSCLTLSVYERRRRTQR